MNCNVAVSRKDPERRTQYWWRIAYFEVIAALLWVVSTTDLLVTWDWLRFRDSLWNSEQAMKLELKCEIAHLWECLMRNTLAIVTLCHFYPCTNIRISRYLFVSWTRSSWAVQILQTFFEYACERSTSEAVLAFCMQALLKTILYRAVCSSSSHTLHSVAQLYVSYNCHVWYLFSSCKEWIKTVQSVSDMK